MIVKVRCNKFTQTYTLDVSLIQMLKLFVHESVLYVEKSGMFSFLVSQKEVKCPSANYSSREKMVLDKFISMYIYIYTLIYLFAHRNSSKKFQEISLIPFQPMG